MRVTIHRPLYFASISGPEPWNWQAAWVAASWRISSIPEGRHWKQSPAWAALILVS